jgi:hypothetical protein
MIVQIEEVDEVNYVVRCVRPDKPAFKPVEVRHSLGKAFACAQQMFCWPNKAPAPKKEKES